MDPRRGKATGSPPAEETEAAAAEEEEATIAFQKKKARRVSFAETYGGARVPPRRGLRDPAGGQGRPEFYPGGRDGAADRAARAGRGRFGGGWRRLYAETARG
ncbi:hypothetical protein QJS10_CPB17g00471 [Acorus calamus]|uniref:Uncharacterized protein n=1 Tax=Acorus calamus TaxID=4465 RepID=A0AAV9CY98_ACOCL|nr:hypothetical protein QJS10_CPB17g00471 [Acorus calamus]